MGDLRICRICVITGTKMYRLERFYLRNYYEEVTASKINDNDNLPKYFCYECAMMLHKFHKFKEKCYSGIKVLKEMQWRGPITYENISKVDRNLRNIPSILQIIKVTNRIKHYNMVGDDPPEYGDGSFIKAEDQTVEVEVEVDYIGDHTYSEADPVADNTEIDNTDIANTDIDNIAIDDTAIETTAIETTAIETTAIETAANDAAAIVTAADEETIEEQVHRTIYLIKKEHNELHKSEDIVEILEGVQTSSKRGKCLSDSNWKMFTLTEEGAVKEFCARAQSSGYLRASYKCTDCYKGFSQEEMLQRHLHLRHDQALENQCRFCKMRFKWHSSLTMHIRQHFMKYQCQLCTFVCARENSALLHEQYHSGVKRKCLQCGQLFRHSSTYYTHMRTSHRSEYICTVCGGSFVSETGLHQHKRVKHVTMEVQDSPDDDEPVNTFCERCNISFTTRKAYEEHLFHSSMHTEFVVEEVQDEVTIPNKVMSKRVRAQVTKKLIKRESTEAEEPSPTKKKRRRKIMRLRTKPTTCYQCGQHFETQSACMKHHHAVHPGTCFTAPALRHICELCGASLAPGSVAIHNNMHTREKVYSCETCGKEFHSNIGLKRHLVTHTGEKPFACTLCDKRFTQSNSMKLHYRTFHLKEPYPKRRDRPRKRKNRVNAENSSSEEEMRSELDSPPPQAEAIESELIMMEVNDEESVHYLTLN